MHDLENLGDKRNGLHDRRVQGQRQQADAAARRRAAASRRLKLSSVIRGARRRSHGGRFHFAATWQRDDGLAKPPRFLHTDEQNAAKAHRSGTRTKTFEARNRSGTGPREHVVCRLRAYGHSIDLLINAIIAGLLLGGFYAAVTAGISISFGMLDIVNIAHPAFIILGSYIAYIVNINFGIDPIMVSIIVLPAFYVLGDAIYQRLLPVVRKARPGIAARPRLLLRRAVRHRGRADPRFRRRLPLRRGGLYRTELAASASSTSRCACWCRAWSRWRCLAHCSFSSPAPSPAARSWRCRRTSARCS